MEGWSRARMRLVVDAAEAGRVDVAVRAGELLVEVDARKFGAAGLLRAKPRRVNELDERAIAHGQRRRALERGQRGVDLVGPRRVGEPPRATRREGSVGNPVGPERVAQESSHSRELP